MSPKRHLLVPLLVVAGALSGTLFSPAQGLLPPRQASLIRRAAQTPSRVPYMLASRTQGTAVERWWAYGWATNISRFTFVDYTNQPIAAPHADVRISWPQTVVMRTLDDLSLTNWEQIQYTGTTTVIVPNDRPQQYFQVPIPDQTARVSWDASPTPEVVGYRLLMGTNSGIYTDTIDAGTNTTWLVSGLPPASRFYFAIVGGDNEGQESPPSNEVTYEVPAPEIDVTIE